MRRTLPCLLLLLAGVGLPARAQVTYSGTTTDDAFLATGSPTNPEGTDLTGDNFGAAGVLDVAAAALPDGEFQSVLKFDLSAAVSLFDSTYGTNWIISGLSLELTGSVATPGGQPDNLMFNAVNGGHFVIEWMTDDDWLEGAGKPNNTTTDGVTYDSLPSLLAEAHVPLRTNTYVPPGDNVPVLWPLPLNPDLVTNVAGGGPVSFRFYPADNQVSYVFNSHNFGNGNEPLIQVTAIPLLKILSGNFTNGVFHLMGIGGTNAVYQIQASTDLSTTNWQTLGTAVSDGGGMIQFDDTSAPGGRHYYRLSN